MPTPLDDYVPSADFLANLDDATTQTSAAEAPKKEPDAPAPDLDPAQAATETPGAPEGYRPSQGFLAGLDDASGAVTPRDIVEGDPQRGARAYAASKREGVSESDAIYDLEDLAITEQDREAQLVLKEAPSTRRWISKHLAGGRAIADVLPAVRDSEIALRYGDSPLGEALKSNRHQPKDFILSQELVSKNFEISNIYADHLDGSGLTASETERVAQLSGEIAALQAKIVDDQGLGFSAGQLAGSMMYAPQYGLEGAAAGATLAGMAGVAAAGAPATGGISLIPAVGLASMAGVAMLGATAESTYRIEAGSAYKDAVDRGVDPALAGRAAMIVGAINAGIEMLGLGVIGRQVARFAGPTVAGIKDRIAKAVFGSFAKDTVVSGLRKQTAKDAVVSGLKVYAGAVAEETAAEVAQEAVSAMADEIVSSVSGLEGQTPQEIIDRLTETAIVTAKGMLVLGAIGGASTIGTNIHLVRQARDDAKILESVAESIQSASKAPDKAEAVKDVVQAQAEDAGKPTVYIDGVRFAQAMTEAGVSAQDVVQVVPGVDARAIETAGATGADIEIPTAVYAQKIVGTKLGDTLRQDVRLSKEGLSAREAATVEAETREILADVQKGKLDEAKVDSIVAGVRSLEARELYPQLWQKFYSQLTEAAEASKDPDFTQEKARAQAKYGAWVVINFARRNPGVPIERIMELVPTIEVAQRLGGGKGPALKENMSTLVHKDDAIKSGKAKDSRYDMQTIDYAAAIKADGSLLGKWIGKLYKVPGIKNLLPAEPAKLKEPKLPKKPEPPKKPALEEGASEKDAQKAEKQYQKALEKYTEAQKKYDQEMEQYKKDKAAWDAEQERLKAAAEKIITRIVDNLAFLLGKLTDEQIRRAKLWYEGGRRFVEKMRNVYKITAEQGAAVIAVLSPQRDWFSNLSLAERICDMVYGTGRNVRVEGDIVEAMGGFVKAKIDSINESIWKKYKPEGEKRTPEAEAKAMAHYKELEARYDEIKGRKDALKAEIDRLKNGSKEDKAKAAALRKEYEALKVPDDLTSVRYVKGAYAELDELRATIERCKRFGDLEAAFLAGDWVACAVTFRAVDLVHNPRAFNVMTPEGAAGDKVLDTKGDYASITMPPFGTLANAFSILSDGSPANIFLRLGEMHKVRNFDNNLYDPLSKFFATIDTHAVAAALMLPLSSGGDIVSENFSGVSSSVAGTNGVYPLYFEAYRRAADKFGYLPREMQSITWEAIRVIFTDEMKRDTKFVKWVENVWERVDKGEITEDQARNEIYNRAMEGRELKMAWEDTPVEPGKIVKAGDTYDRSHIVLDKTADKYPKATIEVDLDSLTGIKGIEELNDGQKLMLTMNVFDSASDILSKYLGFPVSKPSFEQGALRGTPDSRVVVHLNRPEKLVETARLLGRLFGKDAVRVTSEEPVEGLKNGHAVLVQCPAGYSPAQVNALFSRLNLLKNKSGQSYFSTYNFDGDNMILEVESDALDAKPEVLQALVNGVLGAELEPFVIHVKPVASGEISIGESSQPTTNRESAAEENSNALQNSEESGRVPEKTESQYDQLYQSIQKIIERNIEIVKGSDGTNDIGQRPSPRDIDADAIRDFRPDYERAGYDPKEARGAAQLRAVKVARLGGLRFNKEGLGLPREDGLHVKSVWTASEALKNLYNANGIDTPPIYELESTPENAKAFAEAIQKMKDAIKANPDKSGKEAAVWVYTPEEYQDMKLFLTADRTAGVAVKPNGDIVSVFNGGEMHGLVHPLLDVALANGGNHLDCFDTALVQFYAPHGFRAITRMRFSENDKPEGWDYKAFIEYNNGRPDVVYMAYDPSYMKGYDVLDPGTYVINMKEAQDKQTEAARNFAVQHAKENKEESFSQRIISALNKFYQKAWHGSPYYFTKFSLDHIGEGEGVQAHGWGLYFALNKETAEGYRQGLKLAGIYRELSEAEEKYDDPQDFGEALLSGELRFSTPELQEFVEAFGYETDYDNIVEGSPANALLLFQREGVSDNYSERTRRAFENLVNHAKSGTLYEVNIPDDDVLLNEQLSIREQPEKVKGAIRKLYNSLTPEEQLKFATKVAPGEWGKTKREAELSDKRTDLLDVINAFNVIWDATEKPFRLHRAEQNLLNAGYSAEQIQKFKSSKGDAIWESAQYIKRTRATLQELNAEIASEKAKREAREKERLEHFADEVLQSHVITGERFYNAVAYAYGGWHRSPKEASLALNAAGVKGIRYEGGRDGPCAVIFDDEAIQIVEFLEKAMKEGDGPRGSFTPSTNTITLTPNADLSTFSHEMGHWYLEAIMAISKEPGASQSIKDDVATILKEFHLNSVEEWDNLSFADKEVLHEAFAGWVEIYLAEGKAPTERTRGFFERLGKWIRGVYRVFTGGVPEAVRERYREQLGIEMPELSDEVRRVLDRMVASEEDLERAEEINALRPLFETKPEGMSDDDWDAMQREAEEAFDAGTEKIARGRAKDEKWYANQRSSILRKKAALAKRVRKEMRDKVEAQVNERSDYRALELMKAGDHANVVPNCKLSADALKEMGYNINQVGKLRGLGVVAREGGVTPENARELLRPFARFNSGKQLVNALLNLEDKESLIERLTTERCLREHSELFDQQKLDAAVTEALHNDARSRLLAHELAWLNNESGSRSRVHQAAVRAAAKELVNGEKLTEATPQRHLAMEARWGRVAHNALTKGDRVEALRAKRMQAIHHEAAKLCIDAQKLPGKMKDIKTRAFGKNEDMGKRFGMPLIHAVRYLLVTRGAKAPKKGDDIISAAIKELDKIEKYDPDSYAIVRQVIARWEEAPATMWPDMTVGQATAFVEDVKLLYKMARDAGQIRNEGRAQSLDEAVNTLVDQHKKMYPKGEPAPIGTKRSVTDSEAAGFGFMRAKTWIMRVENWCRAMDGTAGGPFMRLIFNPVVEALSKWRNANAQYQERLLKLLEPMRKNWASVRDIEASEIGYTFTTKEELIAALLHTGNESNKRKLLMGGRGKDAPWCRVIERTDPETGKVEYLMDTSAWDAFISRCYAQGIITKEDMDFVQSVWDLLEDTKVLSQKAFYQLYGDYFEEVEASPITTPWGKYRGGYVPARTSPILDANRQDFDELDAILKNDTVVSSLPVTRPGFSISRVEYNKPLDLDMSGLATHISEVLRFAYAAPVCMDVYKILRDEDFQAEINSQNPHLVKRLLIPWLKRAYTQSIYSNSIGPIGHYLTQLRGIAGMGIMAGHIVNALQQMTGLSVALKDISSKDLAHGFKILMTDRHAVQRISELSPFMSSRLEHYAYEFQDRIASITSTKDGIRQAEGLFNKMLAADRKLDSTRAWIGRHAYFLQTGIQVPLDVIVWTGAYSKALDEGLTSHDAALWADSVVRTSQSSFNPEDIANVETGDPFTRLFLVFYNYFGMQLNALAESYSRNKSDLDAGTKSWLKAYGTFGMDAIFILWVPSVVAALIAQAAGGFPDDDGDDEWGIYELLRLFISEPLKNVIAMVPYGGGAINSAGTSLAKSGVGAAQFVWGSDPFAAKPLGSPAVDVLTNAISFMAAMAGDQNISARTITRNLLDLMSMITRIPFGALKKPLGFAAQASEEGLYDDEPLSILGGAITGRILK